jgi:hypothetical protein
MDRPSRIHLLDIDAGLHGLISVAVNYPNNSLLIADKLEWVPLVTVPPPPPVRPTLRFITANNSTFNTNDKLILVGVADPLGVIAVRLLVDGAPVCVQTPRPTKMLPGTVTLRWTETNIPKASYTLTAIATNAAGTESLPVSVTVTRL